MTKVLNLYSGIGGNRKKWEGVDVTAVEIDEEIANVYKDHFPNDEIIVGDAHEYLIDNLYDYDVIWSSPPCPTHSDLRQINAGPNKQHDIVYPDMTLYEEIILLKHHFNGDYVVENVRPYYEPLIEPQEVQRHYFWSNFKINDIEIPASNIVDATIGELEEMLGFDLSGYDIKTNKKRKVLRNCVKPSLGNHVLSCRTSQQTLSELL